MHVQNVTYYVSAGPSSRGHEATEDFVQSFKVYSILQLQGLQLQVLQFRGLQQYFLVAIGRMERSFTTSCHVLSAWCHPACRPPSCAATQLRLRMALRVFFVSTEILGLRRFGGRTHSLFFVIHNELPQETTEWTNLESSNCCYKQFLVYCHLETGTNMIPD